MDRASLVQVPGVREVIPLPGGTDDLLASASLADVLALAVARADCAAFAVEASARMPSTAPTLRPNRAPHFLALRQTIP